MTVVSSLALPLATLVTNTALQLNNQIVPLNCLRIKDVLFYFQLLKQKKLIVLSLKLNVSSIKMFNFNWKPILMIDFWCAAPFLQTTHFQLTYSSQTRYWGTHFQSSPFWWSHFWWTHWQWRYFWFPIEEH